MTPHSLRVLAVGVCTAAVTASLCGATGPAAASTPTKPATTRTAVLSPQTRADLEASMRSEAFACASFHLFAVEAAQQGHPAAATLFRRTAVNEFGSHLADEAALVRLVRDDAANLRAAISGETYESITMYPRFAREAKEDGDTAAAKLFTEIARDEAGHRKLLAAALLAVTGPVGSVPLPPGIAPAPVRAGVAKIRAARTLRNLATAMHGEALAHARYRLFAAHALKHGRAALASLWLRAAEIELREHFAAEARLAGTVRGTRDNLRRAIADELHASVTTYPRYALRARAVRDLVAARIFRRNALDDARHAVAFQRMLDRLR